MSSLAVFSSPIILSLAIAWKLVTLPIEATLRVTGKFGPKPLRDVDLSGRIALVTGANTGIGKRTALHLARMGADVIMACRSIERGEKARVDLEEELRSCTRTKATDTSAGRVKPGSLRVMQLDLGDLESVRAFAKEFKKKSERLDVLVNNAGLNLVGKKTADGLDAAFGINYVGHFLLTNEVMPLLQSTPNARVICLSSVTHHLAGTRWWDASGGHPRAFSGSSYCDSKLAMVLFAKELRRRFKAEGSSATAFAVNPGAVRSDIWRQTPSWLMPTYDLLMRGVFLSTDQGCYPSVFTSAAPLEKLSGDYYQPYWMPLPLWVPFEVMGMFVGCSPGRPSLPRDEAAASRELWSVSERIIATVDAERSKRRG